MKNRICLSIVLFAICCLFAEAAPVTNWHTFRPTRPTALSHGNTSSPVFGLPTATSSSAFLIGYFDAVSLTNLGDRLVFKFQVRFTDADGMSNNDDQFRFALYDINDQPRLKDENVDTAGVPGYTDNWRGYWFGVDASQPGAIGSIRKRTQANVHPIANAGTLLIESPTGVPVNFRSAREEAGGPVYSGEMAIERTPSGLALAGVFTGNDTANFFAANDVAPPYPTNYSAVGFLNGASSNCDQMNFQDVTVNYAVSNAIQIVNDPSSTNAKIGETAEFHVTWGGSGIIPAIQWLENGTELVGATNRVLRIEVTKPSQNNNVYSAVVRNIFGDRVTSGEAVLSVSK